MLIADSATAVAPALRRIGALTLTILTFAAMVLFGLPAPRATAAQANGGDAQRLRLDVDDMSPRVVRSDDDVLKISGSITNTSNRRIDDLVGRVELGNRLTGGKQARTALQGPLPRYRSTSRFMNLSGALQPGESTSVRFKVPLDGSPAGLAVPQPGVYPLLVNVNGTPEFGDAARLVAFNLLLPVLTSPEGVEQHNPDGSSKPLRLTLLWPITTRHPRVVRDVSGESLMLSDDSLAKSLAPGGRLDGLVEAASDALERGELSSSMCFAVDPALLSTVEKMTDGYQVRTGNGLESGDGAVHAEQWLSELRDLVADHCVVQTSYAGADLNTLAELDSGGHGEDRLLPLATNGADEIEDILETEPRKHVVWPSRELSGTTLEATAQAGVSQLITSSAQLPDSMTESMGTTGVDVEDSDLRIQTFDPLLHRALHPPDGTAEIAAQNGIGALLLRIRQERPSDTAPSIVAPPQHWNASPDEMSTFLRTLSDLAEDDEIDPLPLQKLLRADTTEKASTDSEIPEKTSKLSSDELSRLDRVNATTTELAEAMSVDAASMVRPEELLRPLRQGVLRVASTAWHGTKDGRTSALRAAQHQIAAITSQVTVKPPAQPIALASDESPLPVYISNNLPVTVTVGVSVRNNRALRPDKVPYQKIPANSSRNRNINIEPLRAGRISAEVELETPQGIQLGEPTRFELASTQYGTITLVVTGVAGAALLLLSSRRIYRRLRSRSARE